MASFMFAVPNIVFGQGKAAEMYVSLEGLDLVGLIGDSFFFLFQNVLNQRAYYQDCIVVSQSQSRQDIWVQETVCGDWISKAHREHSGRLATCVNVVIYSMIA